MPFPADKPALWIQPKPAPAPSGLRKQVMRSLFVPARGSGSDLSRLAPMQRLRPDRGQRPAWPPLRGQPALDGPS